MYCQHLKIKVINIKSCLLPCYEKMGGLLMLDQYFLIVTIKRSLRGSGVLAGLFAWARLSWVLFATVPQPYHMIFYMSAFCKAWKISSKDLILG